MQAAWSGCTCSLTTTPRRRTWQNLPAHRNAPANTDSTMTNAPRVHSRPSADNTSFQPSPDNTWFPIMCIIHRRRRADGKWLYEVEWLDGSTSWLPAHDIQPDVVRHDVILVRNIATEVWRLQINSWLLTLTYTATIQRGNDVFIDLNVVKIDYWDRHTIHRENESQTKALLHRWAYSVSS